MAGAEPCNSRAVTHGASARLKLAPRVEELRAGIAELVPAGNERDLPAMTLLAWQLIRIEQANTPLAEHGIFNSRGGARPVLKVALDLGEQRSAAQPLVKETGTRLNRKRQDELGPNRLHPRRTVLGLDVIGDAWYLIRAGGHLSSGIFGRVSFYRVRLDLRHALAPRDNVARHRATLSATRADG